MNCILLPAANFSHPYAYIDTATMEPGECNVERLSAKEFVKVHFGLE